MEIAFRSNPPTIKKLNFEEKNVAFGFSDDLDGGSKTLQHLLSNNLTISLGITQITAIRFVFDWSHEK